MKALVYHGKRTVSIDTVPTPCVTESKDAVVKVTVTTVCGSDLHLWNNEIPEVKDGDILGHEAVGIVESVGADVKKIQKGMRVVVSAIIAEGSCEYCKREEYSLCDCTNPSGVMEKMYGNRIAGIFGYSHLLGGYPGAQAEYIRVPFADMNLLPLPDDVPDETALTLSDIACTGYHATELTSVLPGHTVAVWGCGPVGLMAQSWSLFRGAKKVIAIDCVPARLALAKQKLGVDVTTINFKEEDVVKRIKELVPNGPDACIDATGFDYAKSFVHKVERMLYLETDAIDAATEAIIACRKGGTVSFIADYIGYSNHFPMGAFMEKGLTARGGQVFVQRYWHKILSWIRDGKFDPTFVLTHRLPFDETPRVYATFDAKEDGMVKAVLYTRFSSEGKILLREE
ncbi:hypothetical protein HK104_006553 [Borealophlyctis nickersoniae]|nr:hypothetical protein HK104_006553 [Borealophlyctis nickersoniae]